MMCISRLYYQAVVLVGQQRQCYQIFQERANESQLVRTSNRYSRKEDFAHYLFLMIWCGSDFKAH